MARLLHARQDLALAGVIALVVAGAALVGGLALIEHDFAPGWVRARGRAVTVVQRGLEAHRDR